MDEGRQFSKDHVIIITVIKQKLTICTLRCHWNFHFNISVKFFFKWLNCSDQKACLIIQFNNFFKSLTRMTFLEPYEISFIFSSNSILLFPNSVFHFIYLEICLCLKFFWIYVQMYYQNSW